MALSMARWVGKVAIVTGASAGIGKALATNLAKNGLVVVGFARRKDLLDQLSQQLSTTKGAFHGVQVDMTKEEDILRGFHWTRENLGAAHILVNNAGLGTRTKLLDGKTEEWRSVFDVNVLGLCIATKEATKVMIEEGIDGHVIHINSVAGHVKLGQFNVYSASKHAVTTLTETLRQELNRIGSKIKVTSISPGLVESELTPDLIQKLPYLKPEDIAEAMQYVLSTPPHVQVQELMIRPVGEY